MICKSNSIFTMTAQIAFLRCFFRQKNHYVTLGYYLYLLVFRISHCSFFTLLFNYQGSKYKCSSKLVRCLLAVRYGCCCLNFLFFENFFCWWFLFKESSNFDCCFIDYLFGWSASLSNVILVKCVAPLILKVMS